MHIIRIYLSLSLYIYIQVSKKLLQKIVLNTKVEHYIKQKEWWFLLYTDLTYMYRKIPTQRPPPSKRPPPFSAPKVLQRGHISSCNRPERLFLGTCRLTLYEKCSVMVTFLFHQLSCQMSKTETPEQSPTP